MRQLITYLMLVASISVSLASTPDSLYYEIVYRGSQDERLHKHNFIYDQQNNLILQRVFQWNEAEVKYDKLQVNQEFEREYDSNGNQTLQAQYLFHPPAFNKEGCYKYEYTYDQNNNLTSTKTSNWDRNNGAWLYSTILEEAFDNNNRLQYSRSYKWDNTSQQWNEVLFSEKDYKVEVLNSYGKPDSVTNYHYDSSSKAWMPTTRDIYEYLPDSTENIHINYVYENNVWKPVVKEVASDYKYEGREIKLCYKWENNSWVESYLLMSQYQYTYTYYADPNEPELWVKTNNGKEVLKFNSNHCVINEEHYSEDASGYIGSVKYIYDYNADDKQTLAIEYLWNNSSKVWYEFRKWKNTYSNGKNDTTYVQDHNGTDWENYLLTTYEYNVNGERTCRISNYWNSDNSVTPNIKYLYDYDSQGSLISETFLKCDTVSGNWKNDSRDKWHYDYSLGIKLKRAEMKEKWDDDLGIWYGGENSSTCHVWNYDLSGREIMERDLYWEESEQDYASYSEKLTDYHSNGQIKLQTQTWYENNSAPLEYEKLIQDFDSVGYLILKEEYVWSNDLNKMVGETKVKAEYTNDRLTLSEEYKWDETADDWAGHGKYTKYYDSKDRIKVVTNYAWNSTDWSKSDSRTYYYERPEYTVTYNIGTEGSTKDQTVFTGLHYGDTMPSEPTVTPDKGWQFMGWNTAQMPQTVNYDTVITAKYGKVSSINSSEMNSVSIYPNPATDYINIITQETNAEVTISNMQGKIVYLSSIVSSNAKIDISNLPHGIYVLKVGNITKKVIIQ